MSLQGGNFVYSCCPQIEGAARDLKGDIKGRAKDLKGEAKVGSGPMFL